MFENSDIDLQCIADYVHTLYILYSFNRICTKSLLILIVQIIFCVYLKYELTNKMNRYFNKSVHSFTKKLTSLGYMVLFQ